jgi:hypothetical protein
MIFMKKVFLFLGLSLSVIIVNAQAKYGLKGGLNISNLGGSDIDDNKAKLGFHLGGYVEVPLQSGFSIQPELVFSTMGCKFEDSDDLRYNLNYLTIPVMAKYTFSQGIFLESGPQLGILLSAKAKNDDDSENIKDDLKGTSFFWNFGLGYQPAGSQFGANVRYNLGLSRIDEDGDLQIFNRVWQIGVFYQLGTGKK